MQSVEQSVVFIEFLKSNWIITSPNFRDRVANYSIKEVQIPQDKIFNFFGGFLDGWNFNKNRYALPVLKKSIKPIDIEGALETLAQADRLGNKVETDKIKIGVCAMVYVGQYPKGYRANILNETR